MALNHRKPDETRASILGAAQAAFGELGYDRASVAEVCLRAGVTKGAFYHHFESKQALFFELLDGWLEDMDARLDAFAGQTSDVPAQLVAMTGVLGHVLTSAREQLPIYLEYLTQALRDPALRQATVSPYYRFHTRIADMIRRGIAEGTLQNVPPEATASTILALVMGLLIQALLAPESIDTAQAAAQGMRVLLAAITRE
ncbi:MAG: TetR/AcrR family transcriptional regulator [Anaerolineae bacterium]